MPNKLVIYLQAFQMSGLLQRANMNLQAGPDHAVSEYHTMVPGPAQS